MRLFEGWAVVTGRTQAAGEYQGVVAEVTLRFTDVFAYRHGNWQVVASQATLIGQMKELLFRDAAPNCGMHRIAIRQVLSSIPSAVAEA